MRAPPRSTKNKPHQRKMVGVTQTRLIAADVCADMRSGYLLDPSFERRISAVESRDRRWTQELLYGMLRNRGWLDAVIDDRVKGGIAKLDPDLVDLLRLGAYQLLRMGSVPAYAAIAQTVEIAKSRHGIGASKLTNAVLRRIERERDELNVEVPKDSIDALALEFSHPRWLVGRWVERWGIDAATKLLESNNSEAPVIARPYGITSEALLEKLEASGVKTSEAPLSRTSIRIGSGVSLVEIPEFQEGLFFIQDPAATLVVDYADIPNGSVVLDLCSAPGGKAFELSRRAKVVYCGDRSFTRLQRLRSTIERLGINHLYPFVTDGREPSVRPVDVVLADVPCTGTGTLKRHPDARWRLKISDLAVMSMLQKQILKEAASLVKVGGLLIYSTCSLEPEENEEQILSFLEKNPNFQLEIPSNGAVPPETIDGGFLRILPHTMGADGSFAARLRRTA